MTEEFLSTRQVQLRLNVDRTTVYRMLKDGRLTGVKIGRQWRFPESQIHALLTGSHPAQAQADPFDGPFFGAPIQDLQDVLAETLSIGLMSISPDGEPLTELSNPCQFCLLILNTETGQKACTAHWESLSSGAPSRTFLTCHAGLNYAPVPIGKTNGENGQLIAGQFYARVPGPVEHPARVERLARKHSIQSRRLAEAAADITILPSRHRTRIWNWLARVAESFEAFSVKQQVLNQRLQQIARICEQNF